MTILVIGVIAVIVVGVALALTGRNRRRASHRRPVQADEPLFLIPTQRVGGLPPAPMRAEASQRARLAANPPAGPLSNGNGSHAPGGQQAPVAFQGFVAPPPSSASPPSFAAGGGMSSPVAPVAAPRGGPTAAPASAPAWGERAAASGGNVATVPFEATPPELVEGERVHFYRPTDGTLQFLPGRLEVLDGEASRHEIRFVKTPGDAPEVTFGRSEGAPYRHVQLRSPTVSRMHARLRFGEGRWRIENLSRTNPVVVNGELLEPDTPARALEDGDRIEMGEAIFRFRVR